MLSLRYSSPMEEAAEWLSIQLSGTAPTEDRIGKLELIVQPDIQCRQVDLLLDLEDRPVAWVDRDARIAGIDRAP
jgi:hypothetical protein